MSRAQGQGSPDRKWDHRSVHRCLNHRREMLPKPEEMKIYPFLSLILFFLRFYLFIFREGERREEEMERNIDM